MNRLIEQPWYVVLILLAIPMLVFGLYFISPWFPLATVDPSSSVLAQLVGTSKEQLLLGAPYILVPCFTLLGISLNKSKWVRAGAFALFLVYTFASLIRLVALGPLSITWIFILALGLIAGVVRLVLR